MYMILSYNLSIAYYGLGMPDSGAFYNKYSVMLRNERYHNSRSEQLQELETKFDLEKKDKELAESRASEAALGYEAELNKRKLAERLSERNRFMVIALMALLCLANHIICIICLYSDRKYFVKINP